MKKPAWISFFGWSFLFSLGAWFTLTCLAAFAGLGANASALGIVIAMLGGPCLFIWIIASLVHAITRSHAQQQAQTMAQLLQQVKQPGAMCGYPGPEGLACDLTPGHTGQHRAVRPGPRAVQTSPLGLTGTGRD
jgi:hypothetical protein